MDMKKRIKRTNPLLLAVNSKIRKIANKLDFHMIVIIFIKIHQIFTEIKEEVVVRKIRKNDKNGQKSSLRNQNSQNRQVLDC